MSGRSRAFLACKLLYGILKWASVPNISRGYSKVSRDVDVQRLDVKNSTIGMGDQDV